ncbi:MAG: NusG domain II-containing protein [Eubacteriales bacterium]|nr:NusG domain II-containing protein [Eubacteriales bacterium]
MKLKKQDVLLLAVFLAVAVVLGVGLLLTRSNGAIVVVRAGGEQIAEFPLRKDTTYTIEGIGGTNELVIENGTARLKDASCPDQLCVHQGTIQYAGESIICLPNQVTVTIEGETEDNGVDIIAT